MALSRLEAPQAVGALRYTFLGWTALELLETCASSLMTPAPQSEEALFQAAAQLPDSDRSAFLDKHCAGEPTLRQRLEALFAAYDLRDDFMKDPTEQRLPPPGPGPSQAPDEAVGMTIGRYKLLEKVGEGG